MDRARWAAELKPMTYDKALRDQQREREEQLRRERQTRDQKVISIFRRKKAQKLDVLDFSYLKSREPWESD
jgi:hypothetical protein